MYAFGLDLDARAEVVSFSTVAPRADHARAPMRQRSRTSAPSPTIAPSPERAAGEHDRVASRRRTLRRARARRAARARRWSGAPSARPLAQHRAVADAGSRADAAAVVQRPRWRPNSTSSPISTSSPTSRFGPRGSGRSVTRSGRDREDGHRPARASAACASSTSTTATPARPSESGARSSRIAAANSSTSRRSGSSLGIRGDRDVARADADVLAVGIGSRERDALVVHRDLAVGVHVVEDGHLVAADDREAARLVRVEPGEVHVGDDARGELDVAEDHVLDAGRTYDSPRAADLGRPLAHEVEQDGDVVRAEAPERVLVGPHLAEVLALRRTGSAARRARPSRSGT